MSQEALFKKALTLYAGKRAVQSLIQFGEASLTPKAETKSIIACVQDVLQPENIDFNNISTDDLINYHNEWMAEVATLIEKREGTISTIMGDAIVSFWEAQDQKAYFNACQAAIECTHVFRRFNEKWQGRGMMKLELITGLDMGPASVGYFGTPTSRLYFNAMGYCFSFAARLQATASHFHKNIAVSEAVREGLRNQLATRELVKADVKGRGETVTIYELEMPTLRDQ